MNSCSKATRKILNCVLCYHFNNYLFCQVFYASVELITDWTYVDMLHILLPDEISHYVAAGWWVYPLVNLSVAIHNLMWICFTSSLPSVISHYIATRWWVSTYSAVSQHQSNYHRPVDDHWPFVYLPHSPLKLYMAAWVCLHPEMRLIVIICQPFTLMLSIVFHPNPSLSNINHCVMDWSINNNQL